MKMVKGMYGFVHPFKSAAVAGLQSLCRDIELACDEKVIKPLQLLVRLR